MTEKTIQHSIRATLGRHPDRLVLWRNNVGEATFVAPNGKLSRVRYGLAKGSSDLIGIAAGGRFVAIEVKQPGESPNEDQRLFLALVKRMGGISGYVTSVSEAEELVWGSLG